jgi:hypothetical protein
VFFVFTGAGLMQNGAGYRSGSRLQQREYGPKNGSTQPASKLGTKINHQPTKMTTQTLTTWFIKKLLHHVKKLFLLLDLLAPEDGEDTHLPENLRVEMGMHLLEEEEGETEMDTAPEGSLVKGADTAAPTTGPATAEVAAAAAADQSAAAAAHAAAAAKLRASQALSDKFIERAAQEAATKKEQEKKEEAALAAYMAANRKEKDIWSRRGSNDSSEFGSSSSTYNSDMPPLYFTTKNKRENAIKTRILGGGGGGILLLRGC